MHPEILQHWRRRADNCHSLGVPVNDEFSAGFKFRDAASTVMIILTA
jgi:hypothetical protein